MRISERLRNVALELATIAEIGPCEVNELALAKTAAAILRIADQVALGERSIVVCPNCQSDLPEGCGGTFKESDGNSCWLNRAHPQHGAGQDG